MYKTIITTLIIVFSFGLIASNIDAEETNTFVKLDKAGSKKDIRTDTIHVDGNCNMCKNRIEDAALIKGVKKATWDKHKDQLVVVYDASKTSISVIEKAVAKVGHDTPNFKADDKVYNNLPKCCQYRDKCCNKTH